MLFVPASLSTEASFGFWTKRSGVRRDIQVKLTSVAYLPSKGDFYIAENGREVRVHLGVEISRESLTDNPVVLTVPGLGRLSLGWDWFESMFYAKLNGVPYAQLQEFGTKEMLKISKQKTETIFDGDLRYGI